MGIFEQSSAVEAGGSLPLQEEPEPSYDVPLVIWKFSPRQQREVEFPRWRPQAGRRRPPTRSGSGYPSTMTTLHVAISATTLRLRRTGLELRGDLKDACGTSEAHQSR